MKWIEEIKIQYNEFKNSKEEMDKARARARKFWGVMGRLAYFCGAASCCIIILASIVGVAWSMGCLILPTGSFTAKVCLGLIIPALLIAALGGRIR